MAYSLHIERENNPITLDEWIDAVSKVQGAKIDSSKSVGINPKTGQEISISGNPGDVSILFVSKGFLCFSKSKEWVKSISFFDGIASFKATEEIDSPDNPVRIVASKLSILLSAHIRGDEGETYDW